jgi:hypothetical protein
MLSAAIASVGAKARAKSTVFSFISGVSISVATSFDTCSVVPRPEKFTSLWPTGLAKRDALALEWWSDVAQSADQKRKTPQ